MCTAPNPYPDRPHPPWSSQELQHALSGPYAASIGGYGAAQLAGGEIELQVQCQSTRRGRRLRLAADADSLGTWLPHVYCLHVSPAAAEAEPLAPAPASPVAERRPAGLGWSIPGRGVEDPPSPSRASPRAALSASAMVRDETQMIDVSLAGCCGVQSRYGGLAITSSYIPAPAGSSSPPTARPLVGQEPFRAERSAPLRHDREQQLSRGPIIEPEDPFEARGSLLDGVSERRRRRWTAALWR